MWEQIITTLGPMVLEAIGNKFLSEKEKANVDKKIHTAIMKNFGKFSDTSLDCADFDKTIHGYKFLELIRNYFFIVNDKLGRDEYINNIVTYILDECPSVNKIDVRAFILELESLYCDSLHKIIQDYPEINVVFQLMSISHREIISQIRDSKNEFKRYLASLNNRDIQLTNEDIKFYHSVCARDFGIIRFTGISGAEKNRPQEINDFYVKNTFAYYGKEIEKLYERVDDKIEPIQLENFFDFGNKIVLIGGAGLGKSTTLNYLFCNYENLFQSYGLKLKIDLKEYAKEVVEMKRDILWCLATEFSKRIQHGSLAFDDCIEMIAYKLSEGQCLIIFDALDEIPTQINRNKVRDEIATFTNVYYLNRFIISTREVGYLKNRFDETFLHIRINEFNSEQIKSYSEKWYSFIHNTDNNDGFDIFWNSFNMEVERARCQNLISNPIILILALVIFDIENCLPTRRVEFYKKCIETFLTERENRKGAFAWSEKAKSILASSLTIPKIAHYKYKNLNANVGYRFSEDELIRSIGEAIEINDSDMIEWTEPITQYSRYLIERTELIHEVDENTLDFAHKTFYEYFLSIYFTKMTENTDLVRLLRKWIGDSNNDELARLIVEVVIQNNDPKQHDIVMNYLFDMLNRDDVQERRFRNRMDVFLLLLDLYEHNLIQPKYQKEYNKFILYNSNYIDHFGRHLKNKSYSTYGLTPYDEKSIANYFWDEVKKGNLILVVDSLKNLSEDYARNVILKDETSLMSHIHSLFSIYNYDGRRKFSKKIRGKYTDVLEIFLNEGLSYALETPQIFLAVLHLSLKIDQDDQIDKLLGYRFMSSDLFHSYMSPETTAILFNKACTSSLHCALLLISIIECMNGRTNAMFNFILMWCGRIGQKSCEFSDKVESFLIFLWMALNDSKDYETFKTMLDSYGVYNSCYDAIFEMTYNHYVEYSKGHYDDEIKTYIAQLNESH